MRRSCDPRRRSRHSRLVPAKGLIAKLRNRVLQDVLGQIRSERRRSNRPMRVPGFRRLEQVLGVGGPQQHRRVIENEIPHGFADLAVSAPGRPGLGNQIRIRRGRTVREHQHQTVGAERFAGGQQFRLAEDPVAAFSIGSDKQRVPEAILALDGIQLRSKRCERLLTVARIGDVPLRRTIQLNRDPLRQVVSILPLRPIVRESEAVVRPARAARIARSFKIERQHFLRDRADSSECLRNLVEGPGGVVRDRHTQRAPERKSWDHRRA